MAHAETVSTLSAEIERAAWWARVETLRELLRGGCPHGCISTRAKPCPFVREIEAKIAGALNPKAVHRG